MKNGNYNGRVILDFNSECCLDKVNMKLSVRDSKIRFYLLENNNHPNTSEQIKKIFAEHNQHWQSRDLSITISTASRYNYWHSKVGDLRSAFLLCFALFGYRYAFSKQLISVRDQIRRYDEKIIDGFWTQLNMDGTPDRNMYIINRPFSAVFVRLARVIVFLPWCGSPSNFYDFLAQEYLHRDQVQFSGSRLFWPRTLEMKMDFSPHQQCS